MEFRAAGPEDLAAVMSIERRAHFHPWSESVIRRYLQKPGSAWVAQKEGTVVGWAVITLSAGEAELLMIAVDPNSQGQGIGRALMNFLLAYLTGQHAEQWFLDVRESNAAAIHLYESMGFCLAGNRPNYYPTADGHEDALLYCLDLQP